MESFRWTADFETGITEVDQQHRQLINLINKIGRLLTENQTSSTQLKSLNSELHNYVKEHFQEEERLMAQHRVDARHLKPHVQAHHEFLEEISKLNQLDQVEQYQQVKSLLDYLIQWLAYHILGIDQVLAKQLQAIQQGSSAAQAYEDSQQPNGLATEPLISALRGLFHQVSIRNRELIELNQNLEKKVQERTLALQKTNRHLQSLAHTDVLTGLPNRRHAMLQLKDLWEQAKQLQQPLACMMIDADHFKQINDNNGHDAGDAVLMLLARALRESVRNDDVVARLGGDEFLLICPNTDLSDAQQLAHSLRQRINKMQLNNGKQSISVSIGVASRVASMGHHEMLIKAADKAVYQAKADGKNCVRVQQDSNQQQVG